MPPKFEEFTPADIVAAMDRLTARSDRGENVQKAMIGALDMLDKAPCRTLADATALMKVVHLLLHNLATTEAMAQPDLHHSLLELAVRHQGAALAFMVDAGPRLDARAAYGALTVN